MEIICGPLFSVHIVRKSHFDLIKDLFNYCALMYEHPVEWTSLAENRCSVFWIRVFSISVIICFSKVSGDEIYSCPMYEYRMRYREDNE